MDLPNPQLLGRDGAFDRLKNYLSQVCALGLNALPNSKNEAPRNEGM
jgi:hypothetical protein